MIGQTISHYKILEKLGEGGMGVVYKAQDTKLDRLVALKFLPQGITPTEAEKKRFIHEAKAASSLDHPNICTVYEIDETPDGQMFLAMAFYEGAPLSEKIKQGPLKIDEALETAIQAAEGLQAAHEKGITHRDIKSGNLMLSEKGQVKLMDFGLAKRGDLTMLTKTGATVGTVPYMSPEQARGEKVDHRTDIWSLGVVLYETVSGRLPFQSAYSEAIVYSILNEEPPPLTSLRSDVPMELERIVNKCLAKHANERYQSLSDMLVDLRKLHKELETGASKDRVTKIVAPPRRRTVLYASLIGLIAFTFVVVYFFLPSKPVLTERKSIAVLPFKNMSDSKEDEYFSDGMTEELINALAKIEGLQVASRTSAFQFKGKEQDIRKIGEQLKVNMVLEGSVRKSGNKLRITAQLINIADGYHLWSETYERTMADVFTMQDEISRRIANALKVKLVGQQSIPFVKRYTENLEAYDLYLRGRYYYNRRNVEDTDRAIPLLERATSIDPNFAAAFAVLGSTYTQKSFFYEPLKKEWDQKAFVAIEKALSIDPNLAEAYVAKGNLLWTPANRFPHEKAIAAYRRAIELKLNYDEAHEWLGNVYYHIGLLDLGLAECQKALQINPGSAFAQSRVGVALLYLGRYEEALTELKKVPEGFNPQVVPTQIAITLLYLGRREEARSLLNQLSETIPEDPFPLSTQALMFAAEGRHVEALQKIRSAEKKEKTYLGHFHHAAYNIGSAYALMKKNDFAVVWLRKAAETGFPCYPKYDRDPHLENVRKDPRFISFMKDLRKQWEYFEANL